MIIQIISFTLTYFGYNYAQFYVEAVELKYDVFEEYFGVHCYGKFIVWCEGDT